jgi:transcriptional regulator with XRE-family HTH domain
MKRFEPQAARELGLVIRTLRLTRKWSQDDLASAARLRVRVIQRAEMGEATTRDERRALADAFGLPDRDAFERPVEMPDRSAIATAFSKVARERVILSLQVVANGHELSGLFLEHPLDICLRGTPLEEAAGTQFEALVSGAREFREMADLYDEREWRTAIGRLQARLDTAAALGVCLGRGVRPVDLELESSSGQQRWRTSVLYLLAFEGACPESLDI